MIKLYPKNHELFRRARILFKIKGCRLCAMYDEFIDRYNLNLPLDKRIKIVDCTSYHDYNYPKSKLIDVFMPHIQGIYPTLFIDGIKIQGANSVEELESFVSSLLSKDFLEAPELTVSVGEEDYPITFNQDCKYEKDRWGRKLICK